MPTVAYHSIDYGIAEVGVLNYYLALDILLSVLGVFGVWCLFKFTTEAVAEPEKSVKALFWDGERDIDEILPLYIGSGRPIVLLTGERANKKSIERLSKLGIEIYRIMEYNVEDK